MGFDAEIDNSERNSVVENLKSEVQCSICCSIFEDPVKLDCCDGHLCKKCYENVKKQFQNCPLCRQANFTAKFSRLMVTVLSQYKLFCPAAECNESVQYANFANHIKSCPALNKKPCPHCKKLYWKNDFIDHFACFEELEKTAQEDKKKVTDLEWKVSELESKLGPITQSRDAHAQNNKTLKAVNTAYANKINELEDDIQIERNEIENQDAVIEGFANKIKVLEQNQAADKKKIQNQRNTLSGLHKKEGEYKVLEQKLEHLTMSNAEWERRSVQAGQQLKISLDKAKSSEMTISRLRSTINRMSNESKSLWDNSFNRASGELTSANQEILRLRQRNRELEEELKRQQNKSSGFFGLFKK